MSALRRISTASVLSRQLGLSHAYSESQFSRTEHDLEKAIRRESCVPPREKKIARLRHKGERIMHSKLVLMMIVVLNLVDCCLVLGELILDIHYIKGLRDKTEERSLKFVGTMVKRYPDELGGYSTDHLDDIYARLYTAECTWPPRVDVTYVSNLTLLNGTFQSDADVGVNRTRFTRSANMPTTWTERNFIQAIPETVYETPRTRPDPPYSPTASHSKMWEDVAHALHKSSVIILGILFIESIIKIICMGKEFLSHKLEVFDVVVVIVSFVVDLALIKGLTHMKVQDATLVLSLLLPWRVIRVVNSLIVAVLDHEHFRLKMLYKEKKMITAQLEMLEETAKKIDFHLQKIESFCVSEGIPKWKIRQQTALCRKQSTVTSMASLALYGMLPGIIMGPADKTMFNRAFEQGLANHANAKHDSSKQNKVTSNASVATISRIPTIPSINLEIIDERHDADDDNEDLRSLVTGSNSSLSTSGNTYKALQPSSKSDPGHLIIPNGSPASQRRVSFGNREMQSLLEEQTLEDADEYCDSVDQIEL